MSHSIKIGSLINAALIQDSYTYSYVGDKVFPLRADDGTTFPFIYYTRTNLYPEYGDKDGWSGDRVSFQINVESDDYDESVQVADLVRDVFENSIISNNEMTLRNIRITSVSEVFGSNDDYIQSLNFECNCDDI